MLKYVLLALIPFIFIGCSNKDYPHLQTVSYVDIAKYQGKWYEIARFEHFFEKGCKNVTANYEQEGDKIKVTNRCTMSDTNNNKEALGLAYAVDETNSKLKVSFFRPFYGDYYILDLADDYSYALVGSPNREYLWILSRTKTIDETTKNKLLAQLPKLGFVRDKLIWTIQE